MKQLVKKVFSNGPAKIHDFKLQTMRSKRALEFSQSHIELYLLAKRKSKSDLTEDFLALNNLIISTARYEWGEETQVSMADDEITITNHDKRQTKIFYLNEKDELQTR